MVKLKTILVSIVLVIVAIIVIFNITGGSAGTLTDAADSITESTNCSRGEKDSAGQVQVYNATDLNCYNSTNMPTGLARHYDLPLNTLFASDGVIFLVLMAAIFITALFVAFFKFKKD